MFSVFDDIFTLFAQLNKWDLDDLVKTLDDRVPAVTETLLYRAVDAQYSVLAAVL